MKTRFLLILVLFAATGSLSAEDRFFVLTGTKLLDVDVTAQRLGQVQRALSLSGLASGRPQSFAGGRYLAWVKTVAVDPGRFAQGKTVAISVADLDTFEVVDVPGSTVRLLLSDPFILLADPLRARLVVQAGTRVGIFEGSTLALRLLSLPFEVGLFNSLVGYAARPGLLLVRRENGTIAFVSVDSGQVRETSIPSPVGQWVVIEPNGNRLFAFNIVPDVSRPEAQHMAVSAYDVHSATLIARRTLAYPFRVGNPEYDASRDRLFFFGKTFQDRTDLVVLDGTSLTTLAVVDVSGGVYTSAFTIGALPAGPHVLLRSHDAASPLGCWQTSLHLVDPASGAQIAAADVAALWATLTGARAICFVSTTYLGPPAAPVRVRATLQGRRLALTWDDVTAATDFEIEAGNGPNLRNLGAIRTGGPTSFEADDVPSGTYFLRVFGLNHQGRSGPSTEVVLTVP
jgi:hypothetical protein